MRDNSETDPDIIAATSADGRNAVLNVAKQEGLGLVTSGAAPADLTGGSAVGGFVSFGAAEVAAIPGQYSEAPIFSGGGSGGVVGGGGGSIGGGGYGGGVGGGPLRDPEDGGVATI